MTHDVGRRLHIIGDQRRSPVLMLVVWRAAVDLTEGDLFGQYIAGAVHEINAADGNARTDGAASVQMARDLTVFDKADQDRIRQALLNYGKAAIAEWTTVEETHSPEAGDAFSEQPTSQPQRRLFTGCPIAD